MRDYPNIFEETEESNWQILSRVYGQIFSGVAFGFCCTLFLISATLILLMGLIFYPVTGGKSLNWVIR